MCVHQQSILCPRARHWAFIFSFTSSRRGYECQLNACKLSMLGTNIYMHIICVLNFHLITVFWASYVAVMIGSGEWITFQQGQPLSSILVSLMMRIGSDSLPVAHQWRRLTLTELPSFSFIIIFMPVSTSLRIFTPFTHIKVWIVGVKTQRDVVYNDTD